MKKRVHLYIFPQKSGKQVNIVRIFHGSLALYRLQRRNMHSLVCGVKSRAKTDDN